ncbi:aspartate/methionine/tyrosine aminotransferase [Silvibacterium bohemicum]|uniref:alanine transaminase n=1 Tax=Silvibacterium bohemicum TaxID=1577686 RepID=A0A841K7Z9_9BACT|nr:pyridoxal phosphate-dependent aminotransferase [Silvibacterium bohemicum]MBB6146698.1 aspartate/methionine/tyrosine aminotransferase [Silvibacterium bohemicum]
MSSRTAWDVAETDLTRAIRERRTAGLTLIDLTASNPTQCGFLYDEAAILSALSDRQALQYDPDPRGMESARAAVAGYYSDHRIAIDPERIFLTTSTSEAYSYLFRLLADPGDEVLIAQPSYPLFDFLAQLEDVRLVPYALFYDHGWHLDIESLRQRIGPKTRAIALVHPNNPTGHFTRPSEREALEELCVEHGLALIVDEVFLDYALTGQAAPSFATGEHPALTFVLSGLSKIAALPQMKAAWIAAFGPEPELADALARLEIIADTFLAMNAPIQCALPAWLRGRREIQQQIRSRLAGNLAILDTALASQNMVTRLDVEAGWYAILRVPALAPDEELAIRLVREHGVSVHPGSSFGFADSGWLVLSLLVPPADFLAGVQSILDIFR